MNIQEAKQEIIHTLMAYLWKDEAGNYLFPAVRQRPVLLMGPPGIGKTAIMEQVAQECGVGLVAYTITHHTRQSAIGLPHIEERTYCGKTMSVTEYTMSEIIASVYETMEHTGKQEGILFLDEINCVSETLAPTMLQFLQNKTFGSHRVPEGWIIVAAGNPPEYNKSVREFDIVTLDRVRQIDVEADLGVWLDYARGKQLHGAVISYLTAKPDSFYLVRRKEDVLSFVTARGGEDLSEILKGYEALGIPVSESLVAQYLRNEATARDFAAYYALYQKYRADYAIAEILNGELDEAAYQEKIAMAKGGGFDERITVVNLILSCLQSEFSRYAWEDTAVTRLHTLLKQYKTSEQSLTEYIAAKRNSLEVKQQNGLIGQEEAKQERWVLKRLEAMDLAVKGQHIREIEAQFHLLRTLFAEDKQRREGVIQCIQTELDNAFWFAADCFGDGQEMILLVSPTMSKAIRDVESELGFSVFKRTPRGVVLTQRGTEFISHAKKIVAQIEKMEQNLHAHDEKNQLFSLAIPRVTYIAQAAAEFVSTFDTQRDMEITIFETSSVGVIEAVASGQIVLGVIRYHMEDEDYFLRSLAEKDLQYEHIWQSEYVAVMRSDHPLAQKEKLCAGDFAPYLLLWWIKIQRSFSECMVVSHIFTMPKR